jgi:hypothetical protein
MGAKIRSTQLRRKMEQGAILELGDLRHGAHVKMEQALEMLDAAGESAASIHLDRAIAALGLRELAVERRMVERMWSDPDFSPRA